MIPTGRQLANTPQVPNNGSRIANKQALNTGNITFTRGSTVKRSKQPSVPAHQSAAQDNNVARQLFPSGTLSVGGNSLSSKENTGTEANIMRLRDGKRLDTTPVKKPRPTPVLPTSAGRRALPPFIIPSRSQKTGPQFELARSGGPGEQPSPAMLVSGDAVDWDAIRPPSTLVSAAMDTPAVMPNIQRNNIGGQVPASSGNNSVRSSLRQRLRQQQQQMGSLHEIVEEPSIIAGARSARKTGPRKPRQAATPRSRTYRQEGQSVEIEISPLNPSRYGMYKSASGSALSSVYQSLLSGFDSVCKSVGVDSDMILIPLLTALNFAVMRPVSAAAQWITKTPTRKFMALIVILTVTPWIFRSFNSLIFPSAVPSAYVESDEVRFAKVTRNVLAEEFEQLRDLDVMVVNLNKRLATVEDTMQVLADASNLIMDHSHSDSRNQGVHWANVLITMNNQIVTADNMVGEVHAKMDELKRLQGDADSEVSRYADTLSMVENNIAQLSDALSKLDGRVVAMAASVSTRSGSDGVDYDSIADKVLERVTALLAGPVDSTSNDQDDALLTKLQHIAVMRSQQSADITLSAAFQNQEEEIAQLVRKELSKVSDEMRQLEEQIKSQLPHHAQFNISDSSVERAMIEKLIQRSLDERQFTTSSRPDYALKSTGGKVIRYGGLTSKIYVDDDFQKARMQKKTSKGWRKLMNLLWPADKANVLPPANANPPEVTIDSNMQPGRCWSFSGDRGYLTILLSKAIKPSEISVYHLPKAMWDDQSFAPRAFEVWAISLRPEDRQSLESTYHRMANNKEFLDMVHDGFAATLKETYPDNAAVNNRKPGSNPAVRKSVRLVTGEYNIEPSDPSAQTFTVDQAVHDNNELIDVVQVRFKSNWGSNERTCVYRVSVHGQPATQTNNNTATTAAN